MDECKNNLLEHEVVDFEVEIRCIPGYGKMVNKDNEDCEEKLFFFLIFRFLYTKLK